MCVNVSVHFLQCLMTPMALRERNGVSAYYMVKGFHIMILMFVSKFLTVIMYRTKSKYSHYIYR